MNIKEAFRYQNAVSKWLSELTDYFSDDDDNVTKITEQHMKSKANPSAMDETISKFSLRKYQYSVDSMIDCLMALIEEKENVSGAIFFAKRNCGFDLDGFVAVNRARQSVSSLLRDISLIKPKTRQNLGSDYKFNEEGNQVKYYYPVYTSREPDFNTEKARMLAKELIQKADASSSQHDKVMIETEVNFIPRFDVNDTLDAILMQFCSQE